MKHGECLRDSLVTRAFPFCISGKARPVSAERKTRLGGGMKRETAAHAGDKKDRVRRRDIWSAG